MPAERPSPYTIPEPQFKFCEGPGAQPVKPFSTTLKELIQNLTAFANFYEGKTKAIERDTSALKQWHFGDREVNADAYRRQFQAIRSIDRLRAYVLANYGEDLTIGTARRVLGDLIRIREVPMAEAESLKLEAAMDLLDAPSHEPKKPGGDDGRGGGKTPHLEEAVGSLSPALRLAFLHFMQARKALGEDATFQALYDWCQEEERDMKQWKNADSWRTAVNRAHEKLRLPKPSARGGVVPRSAVPRSHFGERAEAD